MKKKLIVLGFSLGMVLNIYAGDLVTNTNQNVTFLRNPARDASTEIDATYVNPAGLAFLKEDGFSLSLNNQSAFQTRTITSDFAPFAGLGGSPIKQFEGKTTAWVVPNLQAVYKTGKWAFSANIGIVGGGGTLDFSKGLPSFESQVAMIPALLTSNGIPTTQYSLDSRLKGTQIIYGAQLGVTYKINDNLSAYLGARSSFIQTSYSGYIHNIQANVGGGKLTNLNQYFTSAAQQAQGVASSLQGIVDQGAGNYTLNQLVAFGMLPQSQLTQLSGGLGVDAGNLTVLQAQGAFSQKAALATGVAAQTTDKDLDCKQNGFGVAPILGFDFKYDRLNVGIKYEFKTSIDVKNKTKTNTTGLADYNDKVSIPFDIPAMFSVGAKYDIIEPLTVSVGYHHFFDSDAKMVDNKQKYINGGVNEYLAGLEYRINDMFLISCGTQITRQGITDDYITDISFDVNSVSFGFGGAIDITKNIRANLGYLFTHYSNWNAAPTETGTNTYCRTNKAFGIGLDFKF